jgi:hypothetical protein
VSSTHGRHGRSFVPAPPPPPLPHLPCYRQSAPPGARAGTRKAAAGPSSFAQGAAATSDFVEAATMASGGGSLVTVDGSSGSGARSEWSSSFWPSPATAAVPGWWLRRPMAGPLPGSRIWLSQGQIRVVLACHGRYVVQGVRATAADRGKHLVPPARAAGPSAGRVTVGAVRAGVV